MGAVAHNPEDCGGARLIIFELAAFLGWHSGEAGGGGKGDWSCGGCGLVGGEKNVRKWRNGHGFLYLSETKAYASLSDEQHRPFMSHVTHLPTLIRFVIPQTVHLSSDCLPWPNAPPLTHLVCNRPPGRHRSRPTPVEGACSEVDHQLRLVKAIFGVEARIAAYIEPDLSFHL